ncbi:LysR family transcriptional regulator [Halobacillus campisalis]|uniref:LysR family transcriptional regulator n=1 Tax=Halobacillus campisalis TaxID=435909 RepID=A0ABW2K4T0_9BACI|nr:LysR family transcriptional regulator [Halobacillus campisalis]
MKVEDYRLLIQLEYYKTIRSTARHVLISQPAITQRLRFIEDYFGVEIFVRTSRQLVLTPLGEAVLQHAKEMIAKEEKLHDRIRSSKNEVSGTLSLGVSSLVSQHYLPGLLQEYTKLYPEVTIDLVTGVSAEIKQTASAYHLAILRGEALQGYERFHLFDDPLYLFDTEDFAKGKYRTFIEFKTDADYQRLVEEWMYQQMDWKVRRTMKVDHFETAKQLMVTGLGMTVLPKSLITKELEKLPHIPLLDEGVPIQRKTWACVKKEVRALPQVEAFINLLEYKVWKG